MTTTPATPGPRARRPAATPLQGVPLARDVSAVAALVDLAAGADTRAIEALERVLSQLRTARDAKARLARDVPAGVLRSALALRARAAGGRS